MRPPLASEIQTDAQVNLNQARCIADYLGDGYGERTAAVFNQLFTSREEWLSRHADHLDEAVRVTLPDDLGDVRRERFTLVLDRLVCRKCTGSDAVYSFTVS